MLINFIINFIDTFNIIYLWVVLTKKDNNIIKMLFSVFILSVSCTITENLGINFILTQIIYIITIKIIYKINLKNTVFGFLFVVSTFIIVQLLLMMAVNKLIDDVTIEGLIVELIIAMSIIIFSKIKLLRNYFMLKYEMFEKANSNILAYFISTWSLYVIFFKFLWNYNSNIIINNSLFITGVIIVLILCQILSYKYVIKSLKEQAELKILNEYNSAINEIVQEIKQRQHDFINYKNTIKGIVSVVDESNIKQEISNYIKDEDVYEDRINSLIYINNVVIRSIVYRNIYLFKKNNINFEYEIENNVLDNILSYNEMSNLLGNLLNNAFEEVMKEECIKKSIEIKIFNKNNTAHLIIKNQVVNTSNINLNEIFKRGYSTKNTAKRGYGLYNIQSIVNAHRGNIKINLEHDEILFDIYFNSSG